jgi:hypothetical protein
MRIVGFSLLALIASATTLRSAEPLPSPSGPILLTVSGAISETNAPGEARFDRIMLEAIGSEAIETTTAWTDGVRRFDGVPLAAVLERIGAHGKILHAVAHNDFRISIPASSLSYGPILAMRMDGRPLSIRDKGPLWIVYPRDRERALQDPRQDSLWVWQLKSLRVE